MSTKPTNTKYWTNNSAYRNEPSAGRKNTGWGFRDKPSYRHFNWLVYNIYEWLNWLEDFVYGYSSVGTGCDYDDINDAIADGATKLVLRTDLLITDKQDISLDDVILKTNGFKIYTGAGAIADNLVEVSGDNFLCDGELVIESCNTAGNTTCGLMVSGDCNKLRARIIQNGVGGTLDTGLIVDSGVVNNDIFAIFVTTAGTFTTKVTNSADTGKNKIEWIDTYTYSKAKIHEEVLIQDYTETKYIGTALQQFAGHDLSVADFENPATLIALYNLNDANDLTANANTLNDADAYESGVGIMGVNDSCMLMDSGAGKHLQADATAGWSGNGDLNVSIGGWFNCQVSAGLIAVGTNAADQKMQIYTDANGFIVFDIAGVTSTTTKIATYGFVHCAMVYDKVNSIAYCYVNGRCENVLAATTNLNLQANKSIWIGSKADGSLELVTTYADECFVYEGVLTYQDIQRLYATTINMPSILQGANFEVVAKMKASVSGSEKVVWCDEIKREATKIFLSGGTRRSTDFYKLYARL